MTAQIRRLVIVRDTVFIEGGIAAAIPVTRVAAIAVIANPLAQAGAGDLGDLVAFGEELGEQLAAEARAALPNAPVAYGKAAIVGTAGEIEHAAAILHPRMGRPIREAIGGGKAIISSNVKVGGCGATIDIPLADKDDIWNFDRLDTLTVMVPDAPRPDEIVVIVALSDGGRPRPRVDKGGVKPDP